MQQLFLGFDSAIEYWRAVGAGLARVPHPSPITRVENDLTPGQAIKDAAPEISIENRLPIHALVSRKSRMSVTQDVKHHLCTQEYPAGSFRCISSNVIVASPELSLLQAAQTTRQDQLLPLIELCYEFLGRYSLCDGSARGFMIHDPFLTMDELKEFLRKLPRRTRGAQLLASVLEFVIPNSYSPRETEAALMLSLPREYGGFGFPRPILNYKVALSAQERAYTDKECFYLDLYWEGTHVAFEYDGADHQVPEIIAEDKARRNLLGAKGYRIVVLENAHVNDVRRFNQQIALLAQLLGVELPAPSAKTASKRTKLRKHLFDPRHSERSTITRPLKLPSSAAMASGSDSQG